MTYFKSVIILVVMSILLVGCGKGPGQDLERVYLDYHKALQAGDLDTLKELITSEQRQELAGEDAAMKIGMIKEFLPAEIKVVKTTVSGSEAVLKVEGKMKDQKMTGEVKFLKEEGKWLVAKESWQVSIEPEPPAAVTSYTYKPGSFAYAIA